MLERAKEVTRDGAWVRVEDARYADDLAILVDRYGSSTLLRASGAPFKARSKATLTLPLAGGRVPVTFRVWPQRGEPVMPLDRSLPQSRPCSVPAPVRLAAQLAREASP